MKKGHLCPIKLEVIIIDDNSVNYALFIDKLRRDAKISIIDFCDGICSDRQYRRYINGNQLITQRNISLFSQKLGFIPSDFYFSYHRQDMKETQKINTIYHDIIAGRFRDAKDGLIKMKDHKFLSIQSKRFFKHCEIRMNHLSKKYTKYYAYDQYKELVDYSNCLERKIFDFVDIITIHMIANIEYELGKDQALLFLYTILFDRKFVYTSSDTRHIFPTVYSGLSKILGMKEMYVESERIASIGIEYCISITDFHALPHLYYIKSVVLFKMGKANQSLTEAKKCMATVIAKDNAKEIEHFSELIKNDYKINPLDLFMSGFIKNCE